MTVADRTRSELRVQEAASLVEARGGSAVAEDGTVLIHLIRPCVGKGRGRHVYEADMLRRHAETGHFIDWPMFIDHESPAARRAAGGLPRSLKDLGGRVVEHWWDDTVPAEGRFEQGAVVARVLPVPYVQDLIRHDPKLVEASINTYATGTKPSAAGNVVEGFDATGSVDWVTRAGAGGRIVQLMEALHDEGAADDQVRELLEGMPDDRVARFIRDHRPAVAEHLTSADHGEEDDVTKDQIRDAVLEALRSDEAQTIIQESATTGIDADEAKTAVQEALAEVLPEAIGKAAEVIEGQAVAGATKAVRMGALRTVAATAVQEAKLEDGSELPERFRQKALANLTALVEAGVADTIEGEGDDAKVTETAEEKFGKLVEAELTEQRELVEAARPAGSTPRRRRRTAVTENGGGAEPGKGGEPVLEAAAEDDDLERSPLIEAFDAAGVDVFEAYGVPKPDDKAKTPAGASA